MRVIFTFLFLLICLLGPGTVWAQNLAPDPSRTAIMTEEQGADKTVSSEAPAESDAKAAAKAKKSETLDIAKASDQQIEEAQRFYKSCSKNENMNYDHDCRCLAGEYLSTRMSLGDSVPAKQVYAGIRTLCMIDAYAKKQNDGQVGLGDDYSDAELNEAQAIYNQCLGNQLMALNHDCRCMASTFLEKRRERGRIPNADEILAGMRSECKNGPEMAGYLYTDCINKPDFLPPAVTDAKKFCECYASSFSKEYENTKVENSVQSRSAIAMIAMGTCQNEQRTMNAGSQ